VQRPLASEQRVQGVRTAPQLAACPCRSASHKSCGWRPFHGARQRPIPVPVTRPCTPRARPRESESVALTKQAASSLIRRHPHPPACTQLHPAFRTSASMGWRGREAKREARKRGEDMSAASAIDDGSPTLSCRHIARRLLARHLVARSPPSRSLAASAHHSARDSSAPIVTDVPTRPRGRGGLGGTRWSERHEMALTRACRTLGRISPWWRMRERRRHSCRSCS